MPRVVEEIAGSGAEAVLISLVGQDRGRLQPGIRPGEIA